MCLHLFSSLLPNPRTPGDIMDMCGVESHCQSGVVWGIIVIILHTEVLQIKSEYHQKLWSG
jgi:hypothetical protein